MALIFFGTPQFAVPTLQALLDGGEDISLVVTQPDRVKGRIRIPSPPPVKETALLKGIRTTQPVRIREQAFIEELESLQSEFIVVVAYGKILPKEILMIPQSGCINVHASLLPKYRGAAPIQWALIKGEKTTGVTTMVMDEGLDTGDILLQEPLEIHHNDTSATLSSRLAVLGAHALIETLHGIRQGILKPMPQIGEPSYAPQLKTEDGRVDWHKGAEELCNLVRGMYPWPSAFFYLRNERVKIISANPLHSSGIPGRIEEATGNRLLVGTGKGLLAIEELQPEGKKAMSAMAFLAGRRLKKGDVLR